MNIKQILKIFLFITFIASLLFILFAFHTSVFDKTSSSYKTMINTALSCMCCAFVIVFMMAMSKDVAKLGKKLAKHGLKRGDNDEGEGEGEDDNDGGNEE